MGAGATGRIRRDAHRPPHQPVTFENMDVAGGIIADADNGIDCNQGGKGTDGPRQRAENSEFGAIVTIVSIEGIAHEATITRSPAKEANLPLKLHGRCRDQGDSKPDASVADRETRRKIVGAVDDDVVILNEPLDIIRRNPHRDRPRPYEVVETLHELKREIGLRIAGVPFAI